MDLNNLGLLYYTEGQYAQAEPLHVRALAIREEAFGPEHPDVAQSLSNLAGLYLAQGEDGKAEPLLVRALAIKEKAFGPEHPDVAANLNNLAQLYQAQSQYVKAELLTLRALAIFEKALGPERPAVATNLNNLAGFYDNQGQYAKAEPLYQRALAIYEKALGPEHPDVATSLNNLASLYKNQGQYAKAVSKTRKGKGNGNLGFHTAKQARGLRRTRGQRHYRYNVPVLRVVQSVNHVHEDCADRRGEGHRRGRQAQPSDATAGRQRLLHPCNTSLSKRKGARDEDVRRAARV